MSFYTEFAPHYERIFPFRPVTAEFLQSRLPDRGRVLDLGCANGHYAGHLAAQGLEAIGVDLDEGMITAARERYAGALFVQDDLMAALPLVGPADGAYSVGNVLPHLDHESQGAFLAELAGVLPAGAPWLVQTVNFDRVLPLDEPYDFPGVEALDGAVFHRRYEPRDGGAVSFLVRLVDGDTELFRGETLLSPQLSHEQIDLHREAGFELVEHFGAFDGTAFEANSSGGLVQVYRRVGPDAG